MGIYLDNGHTPNYAEPYRTKPKQKYNQTKQNYTKIDITWIFLAAIAALYLVERFEITILTKTHFFQMLYNTRHNSKTPGMIFRCINAFPD